MCLIQSIPQIPYLHTIRRFLKHIALFSLPFVALLAWMSMDRNYDKEYGYRQLQKDCRSGNWIYRRVFESELPVDVGFIGTSKTMCDVNDSLLQRRLREERGLDLNIANFGICRTGENLHWLIARDLLENKPPKVLFVEVSTHIATNSHSGFPPVANAGDVLFPTVIYNDDLFADMGLFAWNRLIYHRERILGIEREYEDFLHNPEHSFMQVANDVVADSAEMERLKGLRAERVRPEKPGGIPRVVYSLSSNYPKQYYRRIHELCQEKGVRLYFLYLPMYGVPVHRPREADFYESMATILTPPDSIFRDPTLHFDPAHLNQKGAKKLSDWLMDTVTELI